MNSIAVFFTILVATTILGQPVPMGPMNLMELIRFRSDRISTLAQAIQVAGLADALSKGTVSFSVIILFKTIIKIDSGFDVVKLNNWRHTT